jgi:hypothetical protein
VPAITAVAEVKLLLAEERGRTFSAMQVFVAATEEAITSLITSFSSDVI